MLHHDDNEKLKYVPAPTRLDWIACFIALLLCAVLLASLGADASH